jgi:hypothetical protein
MNGRTSKLLRRIAVASLVIRKDFSPKHLAEVKAAAKQELQPSKKAWNNTPRNERYGTRVRWCAS